MPGVVGVMTATDVKGSNRIKILVDDMPLLCETHCPVLGAPVAIVAAQTRQQALDAIARVEVAYEVLPAVRTLAEATAEGAPQVHDGQPNICFTHPQIRGDAETALSGSAAVVKEIFSTPMVHQAPLEPEASLVYFEGEGEDAKLVVIGRGINIHHHVKLLQDAVGWKNIRYEEAFSGGQFGIKLDITAEGIAAAAAVHFRRPVRYICSLTESMQMTTKRHPYEIRTRLGADASGKLTALDMDFTVENGAYTSYGNIIIMRSLQMLSNSYYIPNVKAVGRLVYTNNAWGGAARGAGPPQTNYALESAMDLLALKVGIDPLEFRLMNSLQPGQPMSTGQLVDEWPFPGCLEALRPHYVRACRDADALRGDRLKRGVGIAGGSFGLGKSGPGDISTVFVELNPDDGLTIYGSVADPGEGNDSMLTQIAAHLTGIPMEKIRLVTRNTDQTPDSGSASGSRQTYMSGGALVDGIEKLKVAMEASSARTYRQLVDAGRPTRYTGVKAQETRMLDPVSGQGVPYESRVHGVQMAEVEVNIETGEIHLLKMTAVVDAGTIINRNNVEGQMEGGMDMGAGLALREEYVHGVTTDWATFKFPTMETSFDMEIILLETPRKKGPLGAVGVGEFVLLPTPAAIMNAVAHATGARVTRLPATPERVRETLIKR
jgi:aldehyde oxidoreductase